MNFLEVEVIILHIIVLCNRRHVLKVMKLKILLKKIYRGRLFRKNKILFSTNEIHQTKSYETVERAAARMDDHTDPFAFSITLDRISSDIYSI